MTTTTQAEEAQKVVTGHGHVRPRSDGMRARCGGPGFCVECSREQAQVLRADTELSTIQKTLRAAGFESVSDVLMELKGVKERAAAIGRDFAHSTAQLRRQQEKLQDVGFESVGELAEAYQKLLRYDADEEKCLWDQAAELCRLRARFTNLDAPKYTSDPMLDSVLATRNPEFDAWVASLPDTYWARYDLSAVRIGWEARQ